MVFENLVDFFLRILQSCVHLHKIVQRKLHCRLIITSKIKHVHYSKLEEVSLNGKVNEAVFQTHTEINGIGFELLC
jgi:hypothetical protein